MEKETVSFPERFKRLVLGRGRSPTEPGVFHKLSLVAFLAWIGLGADGVSSSCYGPQEAFIALQGHYHLAIFLALMTAITVFVISASYLQIIGLFPSGGGAYVVTSKLLSPKTGMVAGCALVVDYVLTITVSIASGSDAVFSFLPLQYHQFKMPVIMLMLLVMVIMNLRGVKESVMPIIPILVVFIVTHVAVIGVAVFNNLGNIPAVVSDTTAGIGRSVGQLGIMGVLVLLLHSYSLGGGTYTGIEAVSNGMNLLREPRIETGKRTMVYMAVSLAFIAGGLIVGYLLLRVAPQTGKTLNAVLFESVARNGWGGQAFIMTALVSEALILLVAVQTGFLSGPAVLANMALDGWMPNRFSVLSDHLVTENGILLMGIASMVLLWVSNGSVSFLVVLYSMNVFLVFSLSQLAMVKHWWSVRGESGWRRKLSINAVGLILTIFILVTVTLIKFHEGGWLTLVVTSSLMIVCLLINKHYRNTGKLLRRLDALLTAALPKINRLASTGADNLSAKLPANANTAIILVNGFGGLGLHTLFTVLRIFRGHFKNFVFLQVGVIDAGKFKGVEEIENLKNTVKEELQQYVGLMRSHGYRAETVFSLGTDVVAEVADQAPRILEKFPGAVFFAGQLVFPRDTMITRILHNYTSFAIQKRLYQQGTPVLILPIRV